MHQLMSVLPLSTFIIKRLVCHYLHRRITVSVFLALLICCVQLAPPVFLQGEWHGNSTIFRVRIKRCTIQSASSLDALRALSFNKEFTQYIPLSLYEVQTWMGVPSLYVWDCSSAGLIIQSFLQFEEDRENEV